MTRSDSELAMRRLVAGLRAKSKADSITAASGAVTSMEDAVDTGVAEHAAKTQGVHGVGAFYVAKSSHPSQFPNWADIVNKPDWLRIGDGQTPGDDEHLDGHIDIDWLPIADPGESSDAKLVRADDPRLSEQPLRMVAGAGLGAGWYVCVVDAAGTATVLPATASDTSHAAVAYVVESAAPGDLVDVYFDGVNQMAQLTTTPQASDVGKTVFLATTPGMVSLTPPSQAGQLLMPVGRIIEVLSLTTVRVLTVFETQFYL